MVFISLAASLAERPAVATACAGRLETGYCSFTDQVAFELARAASTLNISLPAGETVSIFSVSDSKLVRSSKSF